MIAKIKVTEKVLSAAIEKEIEASGPEEIGRHFFQVTPIFDYDYECFLVGSSAQAIMFLLGRLAGMGEDGLILVQP